MIAVIVPSRGRPQNIAQLIEAWSKSAPGTAQLHVVVDDDDPCEQDYTRLQMPVNGVLHVIERRRLGGTLNHLAPIVAEHAAIVGFMGDDHRPRTIGWPTRVAAAMCGGGVVYGDDLIQGPALPTAVFLDAEIVRTLGYFVLPGQIHLFMDNYWKTLGEQLGTLRYLPDVVIEHVHPLAGKAKWDDGYTQANSAANWDNDELVYKEWMAYQMPADVAKIRAALA
jgi:hypothetical protein